MFIIFLKFSENKSQASEHMAAHNKWVTDNISSGNFLVAGTLQPKQGGCIVANIHSKDEVEDIISRDPFVEHNIVCPEVFEVSPSMADERLSFLLS